MHGILPWLRGEKGYRFLPLLPLAPVNIIGASLIATTSLTVTRKLSYWVSLWDQQLCTHSFVCVINFASLVKVSRSLCRITARPSYRLSYRTSAIQP